MSVSGQKVIFFVKFLAAMFTHIPALAQHEIACLKAEILYLLSSVVMNIFSGFSATRANLRRGGCGNKNILFARSIFYFIYANVCKV